MQNLYVCRIVFLFLLNPCMYLCICMHVLYTAVVHECNKSNIKSQ